MRRILLGAGIVLVAVAFVVFAGGASNSSNSAAGSYKIELDNAFGLVQGADFKVAGVKAGSIKNIELCYSVHNSGCINPLHAVVTVQVQQSGFGQFHSDAFCQTRPQSLIGEYFVECQPGQNGPVMKPGSTIQVTHTESTIPGDLLQDVMRMPYRERFSLIINELGAGVAGRPADLRAALRRAVPAISETDNLLKILADDSHTLQQLTADSDQVVTALANNSTGVRRFVVEANNTATDTAAQQNAFRNTWAKLPTFLEQLRPSLRQLGAAIDANEPALVNLNNAAGLLNRFFTDLPPFANASIPAIKSLGQASVTGKTAVIAAGPTVKHLYQFSKPTPELSQNLAIVLHDLDDRSRAVERDPRSPGGRGYTGLEALLQYVFNQTLAVNTFGPYGHQLTVDAFVDSRCSGFATPGTITRMLADKSVHNYRQCYAWSGPQQPGVNVADPSNPGACVPDPGGAPPGFPGPKANAPKCHASDVAGASDTSTGSAKTGAKGASGYGVATSANPKGLNTSRTAAGDRSPSGGGASGPPIDLQKTLGQILAKVTNGNSTNAVNGSSRKPAADQTQQLLNYLLAP